MPDREAELARIQLGMSVVVRNARSQVLGRYVANRVGVSFGDIYYGLLPYLHRSQPIRISDLADMVQLENPTVSRHLATLVEQGIVLREAHPTDRRSTLVSLTPKGEAIYGAIFKSWLATIDEVLVGMDEEEVSSFSELLLQFSYSIEAFVDDLAQGLASEQGTAGPSTAGQDGS